MDPSNIRDLLKREDPAFWEELTERTRTAETLAELIVLTTFRKKAIARGLPVRTAQAGKVRLALLGGCTLAPLHELVAHLLETARMPCELFLGNYDNFAAEIMDVDGPLYRFQPQVVVLLPGPQRCKYTGPLSDAETNVRRAAEATAAQLIELSRTVHKHARAEVLLGNFMVPGRRDLGAFRSRTLASTWSFTKYVNMELGLRAPPFIRICDLEFLGNRHGALTAEDSKGWFESKQICSPALLVELAREIAHMILTLRSPPKKVLVLDLDNTLWGDVAAEVGLEGIEIGDTSPRGETFKAFQNYVLSLKSRGILLAICSKNNHATVMEVLEKHPEMVLRPSDFVAIKANWEPKSDNLRQIAKDLNLALDSFVFVDDNPAEIEVVRRFAPEVTTLLLGPDPADYVAELQDCRMFEPETITGEDGQRTQQYQTEHARQNLLASATDMGSYLASLEMEAVVRSFTVEDVPRLVQLVNKSNQFNLTTRRRTHTEVESVMADLGYTAFSVRLRDRFGDHGLISVVIGRIEAETMHIDTWVMSCRVLKRQVEEIVLNELVDRCRLVGCKQLVGTYLPTPRNSLVKDLLPNLGMKLLTARDDCSTYALDLEGFEPHSTKIMVRSESYEPR